MTRIEAQRTARTATRLGYPTRAVRSAIHEDACLYSDGTFTPKAPCTCTPRVTWINVLNTPD